MKAYCLYPILLLWSCLTCPTNTWAEIKASVEISPTTGTVEDTFSLEVNVRGEGLNSASEPDITGNEHFDIVGQSTSTQHTIVNGRTQSEIRYTFHLAPNSNLEPGRYNIPPISITINGKDTSLEQPEITITKSAPAEKPTANSTVQFSQHLDREDAFIGEQVLYQAQIITKKKLYQAHLSEPHYPSFWHESFEKANEVNRAFGNENFTVYTVREALFPSEAGAATIPPRTLTAELASDQAPRRTIDRYSGVWGGVFSFDIDPPLQFIRKQFSTDSITLNVKPLPPPPIASSSPTLVGKIKLASSLDKTSLTQGENLTLVIELYGDGNLRGYELPEMDAQSKDNFKVYADTPQLETFYEPNRILFKKKFSLALVAKRSGTIPLPRFSILTFDPTENKYNVLETSQREIEVLPDSSQEEFQVSGNITASTPITESDSKREITLLGEDLLPQHIGPETLVPRQQISHFWFILMLILLPLLSITMIALALRKHRALRDPSAISAKEALPKAEQALRELMLDAGHDINLAQAYQAVGQIFRNYLGARLRTQGGSLTAQEAAELVQNKTNNSALSKQAQSLLTAIDRARYSGMVGGDMEQLTRLLTEQTQLLRQIEREAK